MNCYLSKEKIDSFKGNVLPLQLLSDTDISKEDIKWSVDSDAVQIRDFSGSEPDCFNNGILLTLMKAGSAAVSAEFSGKTYVCSVTIRDMKTASADDPVNYYVGDLHVHTSMDHNAVSFAARTEGFQIDCVNQIKEEGRLDFSVISDHADVINKRDFFRSFTDADAAQPMELIVFPGCESEVTLIEQDSYGLPHKNSGEMVTINADNYSGVKTWEEFYTAFENSPFAVGVFAHPQIVGWDKNGIWNFSLHKNNTPQLKSLMRLVEMGNGGDRESNLLHEYMYSVALDCGFKVSVCCSSDCHGPKWGYDTFPGKTVIMAPEKSKEAFLDALRNARVYASESGNVRLAYTVNGHTAAQTLSLADKYAFHLEVSLFKDDAASMPVKCEVVSDYGTVVKTIEGVDLSSCDFEIESDRARYFYLRLIDSEGRKTWSAPVWTGRAFDDLSELNKLKPLDKKDFAAYDALKKESADLLINGDPTAVWDADSENAEIIVDMNAEHEICGFGHYAPRILMAETRATGLSIPEKVAEFAAGFKLSVSVDGQEYQPCAQRTFRTFGGEEIIPFAPVKARYVKLEVLTSVGKASCRPKYEHAKIKIGELDIFEKM